MHRFKNILVVNEPAPGAGQALARAIRLAKTNGAQLTIVNIAQEIPRNLVSIQRAFLRLQQRQLEELAGKATAEGVAVNTKVLVGTPFLEIIRAVIRNSHDLVIKPAGGHSSLFGSTDRHLFRKCPCPVWIMKPAKRKQNARILAAVDPDPAEESNVQLNRLILDLATSLAAREKSELHIVHAWNMPYERFLRSGQEKLSNMDIKLMLDDKRKKHKAWLETLLETYDQQDMDSKTHLLKAEPYTLIPDLARREHVELVVMGTIARTGVPGFFIGNTAEKTLDAVDCSVLTVKPAAFSTPVEV